MVALETPVCDFGWQAPDFQLPATDGQTYSLKDIQGEKGTLIMFICNHCPFVQAIIEPLVADCKQLQSLGIGVAAIMSNDVVTYPQDSFENMQAFAQTHGFSFPYLYDESQDTAKAYDAVCTPDFYGFNADLSLQYRGRFDGSGRQRTTETPHDLLLAMQHVAETGQGPQQQTPSIGCSIKWKAA